MKIDLHKSSEKIIGALRVPNKVFEKIASIAKREGVSNQTVVRAILIKVINEIE